MRPSAVVLALSWLIRDTYRQALATRMFWFMLAVSGLAILLCLSVRVEGPATLKPEGEIELRGPDDQPLTEGGKRPGRLSLAFGAVRLGLFRGARDEVHFLLSMMAKWVAGAAGTLLVLVWTAGFLPEFLHPSAAAVLLAKPVPRWVLLIGKYLGVLALVAFQAAVFIVGTWLAMGWATGIWLPGYLWAFPLLLLQFAAVYSASMMLATYARSTVACVFGAVGFWLICFASNYARHYAVTLSKLAPEMPALPPFFRWTVEAAYWALPKPADLAILLDSALGTGAHFSAIPAFSAVQEMGAFHPTLSIVSSLLSAAVLVAIAAHQFQTTDY
jgi:ABC-type transport system involved in multi-copper enzyme maturation permease subunit